MVYVGEKETQAGGCLPGARNIFSCCIMGLPRLGATMGTRDAGALMALVWCESKVKVGQSPGLCFPLAVRVAPVLMPGYPCSGACNNLRNFCRCWR